MGIWETNRGGDRPKPTESDLTTVTGVHASMKSCVQATMPYAIDAIRKYPVLRPIASPQLTMQELNAAEGCCQAVDKLLIKINAAAGASQSPSNFIKKSAADIKASYLDEGDVLRMFASVGLRSKVDVLRSKTKPDKASRQKAAESIPETERLGLDIPSLMAYILKSANWGENGAAWKRKAVGMMPGDLGARIESVAIADDGMALASPVVSSGVVSELTKTPVRSEQSIVENVAQQNNPRELGYGANVWKIYSAIYSRLASKELQQAAAGSFDEHILVRLLSSLTEREAEFAVNHLQTRLDELQGSLNSTVL